MWFGVMRRSWILPGLAAVVAVALAGPVEAQRHSGGGSYHRGYAPHGEWHGGHWSGGNRNHWGPFVGGPFLGGVLVVPPPLNYRPYPWPYYGRPPYYTYPYAPPPPVYYGY